MITKEFLLAGRATLTVDTQSDYFTFHVWNKQFDEGGPTWWFVAQETRNGRYIGKIDPMFGRLERTKKSWVRPDDPLFVTFQAVLDHLWHGTPLPDGWTIEHSGECGACGRALTTPESLARGIGPECWGKRNKRRLARKNHRLPAPKPVITVVTAAA